MNMNNLVTVKMKDKSWVNGKLRGNFTVTSQLAAEIVALIARNESTGHYKPKVTIRDDKGRFKKLGK